MKTFIYTVHGSSPVRGCNCTVGVWRVKRNKPIYVGSDDRINTASWKGDYAAASSIINKELGYKMRSAGYGLESENIEVIAL